MNRTQLSAAVLLLSLAAGCSGPSQPPSNTGSIPSSSATTTVSPSPMPTPSTPEETAKQAVVEFWKVRDELASDPSLSVTKLVEVTRGQALDVHRRSLIAQATDGLKQVGSTLVTPTAASPTGSEGEYLVTACIDVSKVNVVDAEGKSHVPADRPDKIAYDYTVQRDGEAWFVVEDLLEAKPC